MKVINIKQFKACKPMPPSGAVDIAPPQNGQLVRVKGTLTQFVVPEGDGANCVNCFFNHTKCGRIACGSGHYAEIKLPTTPLTAPKE